MTCGFQTASGADLDDLFYTDNGNSGALGFRQSDGTDLGNKYTSAATLGYSVGYRNSAGTDLGYLRGDVPPPEVVECSCTWHKQGEEIVDLGGESGSGICVWGYIEYRGRASSAKGMWEVYPCFTCTAFTEPTVYMPRVAAVFKNNSTIGVGPYSTWPPVSHDIIGGKKYFSYPHTFLSFTESDYHCTDWDASDSSYPHREVEAYEVEGRAAFGFLFLKAPEGSVTFSHTGQAWNVCFYHCFKNERGWSEWRPGAENYSLCSNGV